MASENKDDWRYIGCDTWRLDILSGHYDPAEDMAEAVDRKNNKCNKPLNACEREMVMTDWLMDMLDERQYKIINGYVWMGRSMASIGEDLGITRVRVWQIYKEVLQLIRIRCDGDDKVYKRLFIGGTDGTK
jgi:DNA-directed RNA polymerase specialized sigma subunit